MGLLIRGSVGDEVTALQQNLDTAGYSSSDPAGVYGAGTESAVRSFQDAYGLDADGKAGLDTMAKIAEVLSSLSPDATPPAEDEPEASS
jgi:peptidoglycan hydrolase-like protein with peptidoglycan-binding domain